MALINSPHYSLESTESRQWTATQEKTIATDFPFDLQQETVDQFITRTYLQFLWLPEVMNQVSSAGSLSWHFCLVYCTSTTFPTILTPRFGCSFVQSIRLLPPFIARPITSNDTHNHQQISCGTAADSPGRWGCWRDRRGYDVVRIAARESGRQGGFGPCWKWGFGALDGWYMEAELAWTSRETRVRIFLSNTTWHVSKSDKGADPDITLHDETLDPGARTCNCASQEDKEVQKGDARPFILIGGTTRELDGQVVYVAIDWPFISKRVTT